MTNPLHEKLKEILNNTNCCSCMCEFEAKDIKQIEQAFIDDGWIPYKPSTELPDGQKPAWWSKASFITIDEHKARTADLMSESQWQKKAIEEGWIKPEDIQVGAE